MRVSKHGSRALGVGLVFALAGFTYAVSSSLRDSVPVSPRAVGVTLPLRFTNPNVTVGTVVPNLNEFDLGDAGFGSTITRYVTAEGGLKPYRFTSPEPLSLDIAVANTGSTLNLGISGVLAGKTPGSIPPSSKTVLGTPGLRFQVDVKDARGGTNSGKQSGFFNLFLFDTKTPVFRFANDQLPVGRLDAAYAASLDVLGGRAPVTISALTVTDVGTGMPIALPTLGLFLAPNGSIYGRPMRTGQFTITARATDAVGALAKSRKDANTTDQTVTLNIADYTVTTSDTMTQSCRVIGDTSASGRDSLHLQGIINALGQDRFTLTNCDFVFQLAGIVFSGRLDSHGKLSVKNADGSVFTASVNAKTGLIRISASHGTFIRQFDVVNLGFPLRRPLKIVVGEAVFSSEVLDFGSNINGSRYEFDFRQGQNGTNASGGFQIVKIAGRDGISVNGAPGDAWKVDFVAQARLGVTNPAGLREGLDNITSIGIRVGTNFNETFTGGGIIGAGPKIRFQGGAVDGVQSFSLDTRTARGKLTTRVLATTDTGIPTASQAINSTNLFFTLGLDVIRSSSDAPYTGEHARRIFNFGTQYTDTPDKRGVPPVF